MNKHIENFRILIIRNQLGPHVDERQPLVTRDVPFKSFQRIPSSSNSTFDKQSLMSRFASTFRFLHSNTPYTSVKVVSAIYAAWSMYCLLYVLPVFAGVSISFSLSPLFFPFYLSLFVSWFALLFYVPPSLGFIIFFGELAIAGFYPIASYYLWHRSKKAWVSAIGASLLTVALDSYLAVTKSISAEYVSPLLFAGIALNLFIALLLWHGRDNYLKSRMSNNRNGL